MSGAPNIKPRGKLASDTDSDEEDEAQMRQFLEAADHTLLTNAMYRKEDNSESETPQTHVTAMAGIPLATPQPQLPKSERYLDEERQGGAVASDLQISEHMQTHIWRKLSAIIQNQIEFCEPQLSPSELDSKELETTHGVKLFFDAEGFVTDEIMPEILPKTKPTIKRRQLEQEDRSAEALASIVVSGETIISGQDMQCWAQRKPRQDKVFKYKACDTEGHKLQAIEPTNEFTAQRRKNKWNETKICQKAENKKQKVNS